MESRQCDGEHDYVIFKVQLKAENKLSTEPIPTWTSTAATSLCRLSRLFTLFTILFTAATFATKTRHDKDSAVEVFFCYILT